MIYGKLTTKSRGSGNITYKHIKSAYNVLSVSIQFIDMFLWIFAFKKDRERYDRQRQQVKC
jgi:hypothetical protein